MMAKKTPVPDMNEPAPEVPIEASDQTAGSTLTATPDPTISVQPTPLDDSHQSAVNEFMTAFGKHVEQAPEGAVLGDEAKAGLDDFLVKFERKVSERDGVRKILAAGEHAIAAVGQWPTCIEHALALPLADELDTLHEVEGLVIASFMDVGDVVRKVYLNVLGHFVKA
jgi:hypothetical protein